MERRKFISLGALAGLAAGTVGVRNATAVPATPEETTRRKKRYQKGGSPWPICLDTATIRPASLKEKVKIAASAGSDAIEPWERALDRAEARRGGTKGVVKGMTRW